MTVRVERTFELPVPPERVWEFIVDPEQRARSISVVSDFALDDEDGRKATWKVDLPIPLVNRTASVDTEDVHRDPPAYVKFVGRSKLMRVTGEHEIEATETGSRLTNRFVVDGRLPGVERYFEANLDDELANLEAAIRADTTTSP
ncbi:SRPBCC family protein [Natranaeroarchaeum sulfidigenes]|uniref:Carbon monoxide dehydrogenase subunit G, CoxG n=1 Tax=Natranaeroarchaeum sulfidigenes TaxID=2784880 RepID=A0A897MRY1_9EURY|nr:SRPBCC family protein [Natranaeroarchaeum sulfidigenes]QSG03267.1 Carbon monoxide dehydrogenase subunit G, CoxG [Natranaeroarchaeum sulfidigenes]